MTIYHTLEKACLLWSFLDYILRILSYSDRDLQGYSVITNRLSRIVHYLTQYSRKGTVLLLITRSDRLFFIRNVWFTSNNQRQIWRIFLLKCCHLTNMNLWYILFYLGSIVIWKLFVNTVYHDLKLNLNHDLRRLKKFHRKRVNIGHIWGGIIIIYVCKDRCVYP